MVKIPGVEQDNTGAAGVEDTQVEAITVVNEDPPKATVMDEAEADPVQPETSNQHYTL